MTDVVAVALLDLRDFLRRVAAQSGDDLAGLLGVGERLGRLGLHEVHDRLAVGSGDHQTVVGVAHHTGQLVLEDLIEDFAGGVDVKLFHGGSFGIVGECLSLLCGRGEGFW